LNLENVDSKEQVLVRKSPFITVLMLVAAAIAGGIVARVGMSRSTGAGLAVGSNADPASSPPAAGRRKVAYWWDPMLGPSSISDHPGKSAMNMDLVPAFEDEVSAGPSVRIDPAVVQNMGVTTAPVVRGPLTVTVRAYGMLQVPESGMHDVTVRVNGYVQKLYSDMDGMGVTKGEVLFDFYSPDLQVAEQELIAAQENLMAFGAGSDQTARNQAQDLVDSARQKLLLWDIADQDIDAIAAASRPPNTVPFRSPVSGHIVEKTIFDGSAVQAGTKIMRIEDHSKLWLDVQVHENQLEMVKVGQQINAAVDGVPGKVFTGRIGFIYPHLDHMARTALVRTVLDNPNHELRPGMFASAQIVTQPITDAVLVPREAVIDTGTRQIAFVQDPQSAGHFDPRNVDMGIAGDEDKVQILAGLAPGEQVVTSGQFLMDVESRTTEAIDKLRSGKSGATSSTGSTEQDNSSLVLAHCTMRNADWIQFGKTIVNPYLGSAMSSCGEVVREFDKPVEGSAAQKILKAYLKVADGLDHDRLDSDAVDDLSKQIADAPREVSDALRSAVAHLAAAKDVNSARAAFEEVSAALSSKLGNGNP
jgi:membrane fusion protein, copper/silver efflux system